MIWIGGDLRNKEMKNGENENGNKERGSEKALVIRRCNFGSNVANLATTRFFDHL